MAGVLLRVRWREKLAQGQGHVSRGRGRGDEAVSPGTPGAARGWTRQDRRPLEPGGEVALPHVGFRALAPRPEGTNGRVLSPWLVVLCHTSHGTNTVLGAVDPHSHSRGCVS